MKSRQTRTKGARIRADLLMVRRGLATSRKQAQALIMAGLAFTPSGPVLKAGSVLEADIDLQLRANLPYVGRGGIKLAHALDQFALDVRGLVALDVGASTGGFTDCLLQRGVSHVHALDVGHGQMAYRLRQNARVTVMEGVNAHYPFSLPEKVDIATMDVSFISVTKVIPNVLEHLPADGLLVALVKPQFEAMRGEVPRGGVVKDPRVHARVLGRVITWVVGSGLRLRNLTASPILGDAGNQEFFLLLEKPRGMKD